MKILKQGITEIYDYTCEEIIEETCPVCKAVFEYTENDIKGDPLRFPPLPPLQSYLHVYVACPCCEHKITIF